MRARRLERRRAALTLPRTLTLTATLTLTPALSLNLSLTLTLTLTLGALLASGGEDHAVLLWQLSEGRLLRRLRGHDSHRTINRTLKPQPQPWPGHLGPVWSVSFSAEGAQLASASADCSLGLWDAAAAASAAPEPDPPPAGTGGAPSNGAAGAGAGGAGAAGGRSRAAAPFLHRWLPTKHTPVVVAKFTRTNLLLAAGAYCAPDVE